MHIHTNMDIHRTGKHRYNMHKHMAHKWKRKFEICIPNCTECQQYFDYTLFESNTVLNFIANLNVMDIYLNMKIVRNLHLLSFLWKYNWDIIPWTLYNQYCYQTQVAIFAFSNNTFHLIMRKKPLINNSRLQNN